MVAVSVPGRRRSRKGGWHSWGAEDVLSQLGAHNAGVAAGAFEDGDGLNAPGLAYVVVLFLDQVVGFIPGDALPSGGIAALLGVALHGVQQTGGVVGVVLQDQAPGAQTTVGHGVVFVAFNVIQLSVLVDVQLYAAANWMASRRGPNGRPHNGKVALFPLLRLAHIVVKLHGTLLRYSVSLA